MSKSSSGDYTHEHSQDSAWPVENVVNDILGIDDHHHTITDTATGKSGTGHGMSHDGAESAAWDDLHKK